MDSQKRTDTPTWGGATSREGLAVLEACAGLNLVGVNINYRYAPASPWPAP